MGWLDRVLGLTAPNSVIPAATQVAPIFAWNGGSQNHLASIAFSDIFGGESEVVDRANALSIPAVSRGRNLLVGGIAGLPLRAVRNGAPVETQPTWTYRTDSDVSPWHRMAGTVDDLLFYGWSLWVVARDSRGAVIDALRIPFERWDVNPADGSILVDSKPVTREEVILLPGPGEGLLTTSQRTLRGAIALERAWIGRAQNPIPLTELHQLTDDELDDDEVQELVNVWSAARTSPTGSVGFTDKRVEVRTHGAVSADMFEAARNYSRLDLAAAMGIPGALLDASTSTASLTYSTQEGQRNEFQDSSLRPYLDSISARLSMDDVVPRGQGVRFDLSDSLSTTPAPLGAPQED